MINFVQQSMGEVVIIYGKLTITKQQQKPSNMLSKETSTNESILDITPMIDTAQTHFFFRTIEVSIS